MIVIMIIIMDGFYRALFSALANSMRFTSYIEISTLSLGGGETNNLHQGKNMPLHKK